MLYNEYVEHAEDTSEDAVEIVFPFKFSFGCLLKEWETKEIQKYRTAAMYAKANTTSDKSGKKYKRRQTR